MYLSKPTTLNNKISVHNIMWWNDSLTAGARRKQRSHPNPYLYLPQETSPSADTQKA